MATISILSTVGEVLFSVGAADVRDALEKAVARDANLRDANLRGANLGGAYLGGAYLRDADLRDANLRGADLRGANLGDANLRGANLGDANLRGANLGGAYLRDADLRGANLGDANLRGANLGGASLGDAKGFNPWRTNGLLMLLDQPGPIRAYKLVNARHEGPFNGGLRYDVGADVAVDNANCDPLEDCAAGINLATFDWCAREWLPGFKILLCEFTAADIATIPHASDGKFRVHRCRVISEVDLVERGLIESPEEPAS